MYRDFVKIGRMLFEEGLVASHSGNLSLRKGDSIYVTRHGAMLGSLSFGDIIRVNLGNENLDKLASVEVKVHRAIYQGTEALAIVHAHLPCATALSLKMNEIVPVDAEGQFYFNRVPVLDVIDTIGTEGSCQALPPALRENRIVMVKSHGSFASGKSLEEAYQWTSVLESVSRIIIFSK